MAPKYRMFQKGHERPLARGPSVFGRPSFCRAVTARSGRRAAPFLRTTGCDRAGELKPLRTRDIVAKFPTQMRAQISSCDDVFMMRTPAGPKTDRFAYRKSPTKAAFRCFSLKPYGNCVDYTKVWKNCKVKIWAAGKIP